MGFMGFGVQKVWGSRLSGFEGFRALGFSDIGFLGA